VSLLNQIKQSLRITADNTAFDDEITDLIYQAIDDLKASGTSPGAFNRYGEIDESGNIIDTITDGNIKQCIILFCKAYFGIDNPDKEFYVDRYHYKKAQLLNQSAYTVGDSYAV
jgi:hypothetical protein